MRLKMLLSAIAIGTASTAGAGSVSPWVLDDASDVSTPPRLRFTATAFAASDFAPVVHFQREAIDPGHPPKPGIDRAMGIAQAGAYFDRDGFEVGSFLRMDAAGKADSDVITAIQGLNSKIGLEPGRTYAGIYTYQVTAVAGIRLGKSFKLPLPEASGWSGAIGASASPLHGMRISQDSVSASLYYSALNSYLLTGQRSQATTTVNASDYNAFLPNGTPSATGYTSDVAISLQHADGLRAYLISDLTSKLNWHSVPARTYSVKNFTGVLGTPLPSGVANTAPFSSELERKTTAGAAYTIQSFALEGAVTRVAGLNDATVAVKHSLDGDWSAQLSVHPTWRALGLEIANPRIGRLRIISDSANISRAKALGLEIESRFAF